MKKLHLIFLSCFLIHISSFAQFGFTGDNNHLSIFPTQTYNPVNVNLDSLMLDSIITDYYNLNHIPGLATLIIKDNQIVWNKNYGYRNLEQQLPVEDSTFFYTASISKTIVVTAVMQLWENGMINLEGNINNYLPTGFTVVNPYYTNDSITVKMLMVHTSSLQDNWPLLNSLATCGDSPIPLDTFLINYFMPGGTYYSLSNFYNYPPGQQFNYSNTGASLLALIVENMTGKSFYEYCRDSIFTPLSMNSTSWFLEGMDTTKIAVPYINPSHPICHQGIPFYPAGTLRTNKLELSNFLSAYLNNGVFNNIRILDSTTISYILSDQLGYAIGGVLIQGLIWYKVLIYNGSVWGHYGAAAGAETFAGIDPFEKYGVVWFQNWWEGDPNLKLVDANFYFTRYAKLYGNIYAFRPSVNKSYARKNIDSVLFRTEFSNIFNHPFTSQLIFANSDSTEIDSVTLFDDGLHGDSLSSDGIYGNYIPPRQNEDFYSLGVSTIDNQTGKYFNTPDIYTFTTAGPVEIDSLIVTYNSFVRIYTIKVLVKNSGQITTVRDLHIDISSEDSSITYLSGYFTIDSLAAQQVTQASGSCTARVDTNLFSGIFHFNFDIQSSGWSYWQDQFNILVGVEEEEFQPLTFKLEQNYPDPFNPSTTIRYSIPGLSEVRITLYNLLGEEVKTLINKEEPAGNYFVEFNAATLPSGVYFYQLRATPIGGQAGDFIQTKKMILLK